MINFEIGFQVNTKDIKSQLDTIHRDIEKAFSVTPGSGGGLGKELSDAVISARTLETVLKNATTTKGLSFVQMNAELRKAGTTATKIVSDLSAGGEDFQQSMNLALTSFSSANREVLKLNSTLKEAGRVFTQSLKFNIANQAIHGFQQNLQEAFQWIIDLDKELNQIQIVSGKNALQMEDVSMQILERSKALKVAAQDYAEAAQIYYQQGLSDQEVIRRADVTIKAAEAANESTAAMADMLTAIWNTYQMQGAELENAASVAAKLGAETAIEFRDIAEAMQISASAASQMGVDYNELASIIATVGSTTRQSASVIGNAFKTIFNNFERLKVDGENGEVTLKAASQQLQAIGIQILDSTGNLRDVGDIILDIGNSWETYTTKQQTAIAQIVGGTRQFGQFLALFNNFDYYLENLDLANAEEGAQALESQYSIAIESLDHKIEKTGETWKQAFSSLFPEDTLGDLLDGLNTAGEIVGDLIEGFGGLESIINIVGAYLVSQIPKGLRTVKGYVTDIYNSANPNRMITTIQSDYATMRQDAQKRHERDPEKYSEESLSRDLRKFDISEQSALAQAKLNKVIQQGTEAERVQAEALLKNIQERENNLLVMEDEANSLRRLAESREAYYDQIAEETRTQEYNNKIQEEALRLQQEQAQQLQKRLNTNSKTKSGVSLQVDDIYQRLTEKGMSSTQASAISTSPTGWGKGTQMAGYIKTYSNQIDQYLSNVRKMNQEGLFTNQSDVNAAIKGISDINKQLKNSEISIDAATVKFRKFQNTISDKIKMPALEEFTDKAIELVGEVGNKKSGGQILNKLSKALTQDFKNSEKALDALKVSLTEIQQSSDLTQLHFEGLGTAIDNINGSSTDFEVLEASLNELLTKLRQIEAQAKSTGDANSAAATQAANAAELALRRLRLQQDQNADMDRTDDLSTTAAPSFSELADSTASTVSSTYVLTQAFNNLGDVMDDTGSSASDISGAFLGLASSFGMAAVQSKGLAGSLSSLLLSKFGAGTLGAKLGAVLGGPFGAAIVGGLSLAISAAAPKLLEMGYEALFPEKAAYNEAKKAAEESAKAAQEAQSSYDELLSSIENYEAALEGLEQLKRGTDEWEKSVETLNQEVLTLLTNFPELGKYVHNENGVLTLDSEGLQKYIEEQENETRKANLNAQFDKRVQSNLDYQNRIDEAGEDIQAASYIASGNMDADVGKNQTYTNYNYGNVSVGEENIKNAIKAALEDPSVLFDPDRLYQALGFFADDSKIYELDENGNPIRYENEDGTLGDYVHNDQYYALYQETLANQESIVAAIMENSDEILDLVSEQKGILEANEYLAEQNAETYLFDNNLLGTDYESLYRAIVERTTLEGLNAGDNQEDINSDVEDAVESLQETIKSWEQNEEIGNIGAERIAKSVGLVLGEVGIRDFQRTDANTINEDLDKAKDAGLITEEERTELGDVSDQISKEYRKILDSRSDILKEEILNFSQDEIGLYIDFWEKMNTLSLDEVDNVYRTLESFAGNGMLADAVYSFITSPVESFIASVKKIPANLEEATDGIRAFLDNVTTAVEEREISKDDYLALSEYLDTSILNQFFTYIGDGVYAMTGDAEKFYNISQQYANQRTWSAIDQQNKRLEGMEIISYTQSRRPDKSQLYSNMTNADDFNSEVINRYRLAYIQGFGDLSQVDSRIINKVSSNQGLTSEEASQLANIVSEIGDKTGNITEEYEQQKVALESQLNSLSMMNILQSANAAGIDSSEVLEAADAIQYLASTEQEGIDASHRYHESLKDNEIMATALAESQLRYDQALQDGTDNIDEWADALDNGGKETGNLAETLGELSKSYADLLDIDQGMLDESFLANPENLELFNQILEGTPEEVEAAYEALSKNALGNISEVFNLNDMGFDTNELTSMFDTIRSAFADANTEIGDTLNFDVTFADKLDRMLAACGTNIGLIKSLFSMMGVELTDDMLELTDAPLDAVEGESLGIEAEATQGEIQNMNDVTKYNFTPTLVETPGLPIEMTGTGPTASGMPFLPSGQLGTISIPGWTWKTEPQTETEESSETVTGKRYTIKRNANGGVNLTNKGLGGSRNTHSSPPSSGGKGGGGGGKKSTYKKPTPKVRYTNRENQISRTQQTTEKLAQVEDQLYGRAKLAAMQKKSDLIVQQVKDYKALYDEAVAYREQDMQDLAATQLGQAVPMQIDAEGNILNQEEMDDYMREWKDRIDAIEDEGAKEAEQRAYDISEQAYTYYKEAQEKALEAMKNAVDQLGEWISNEIEKRRYQMEIDIKVSDRQLSLLEFTLEELGSAGWITNWEDGLDNIIDQVDSIMNAGESTIDSTYQLIDLFDKVNNGGLDWSQLDQDMKDMFPQEVWEQANANGTLTNDILEAIGDNTETLLDYAGQLTEAWVSAWEKIGEAMDSYLEQMERARSPLETQAEVLETFISVADQVGWDVDKIDKYNELLDKQTDILEANYEASVKQAEATKDALDAMEPVYQDYLERFENGEITGQQFDVIQEQYYNLVDANQEAISQMTSDWSAYVENLQEKFEIAQQQIIKTWNDGIGNMWNDLAESQEGFDLFESLRTWYLDDFNKDYGLTTLTNQIEDAMNSISDPSRLKEYDAFMAEIVAKQEEGYELSQGELDVLNARFQLMQAQDAYEEAKNNKNTMRLTRDASGNYSYVYSSDSTENQEQAVLDAQKALHDAEEQYLSESESRWYEWMLKKYDLVTNTDWELYAHDEDYRRQFQLQWDQLTQAMQNATNDVNNALTYTDRTYEETAIHHMTNTESMNQANAQYNEQFQILWDEIQAKYKETDQKVQESASLIIDSNLSLEDAANDLMGTIDDTMGNMMDTTDELADNMSSNMQTMIEDTASWSDSIIEDINAIIAKYKELYEAQTNVMQNHTGETKNYEWHMDGNTGQWYYGDNNSGYYKSGWMEIDGKWYFFDDAGYLDMGTDRGDGTFWVDNGHYQVDKDGAWVEGTIAEGHTPGDWAYGSDTKNWGANYGDLAGGNWSNTNSGGQLSSRPSSGSSSNSSSGSSSSNQDYSQYLPFDDILEESDSNFNYDEDGIRVVNPSFNGSHAGGVDNAHWIGNDAEGWFFGTKDKSGRGNQGSYMDGWLKINGKYYHFDEDGWLDTDFNGQDWHDDFPDEENKSAVWRRYAKGGYTGNRGLKGVDSIPAILAPGEYVLNHDDTTKILSAVQLLRGLSSGALAAAANAISKLANGSIPQTTQSEQILVQQDVHIEATFPNVSVASEIEDALNNLVNETVQLIGSQNSRRL